MVSDENGHFDAVFLICVKIAAFDHNFRADPF